MKCQKCKNKLVDRELEAYNMAQAYPTLCFNCINEEEAYQEQLDWQKDQSESEKTWIL